MFWALDVHCFRLQINRGSEYFFSGSISVEGCMASTMGGQFCNQTVNVLSCGESYNLTGTGLENGMGNNAVACRNANGIACHEDGPNTYALDVLGIVEEIFIAATNLTFNGTKPSNTTGNLSLMCYARHGAVPLKTVYDFSVDISKAPLVINFPKAGRWYITIQPVDSSNKSGTVQSNSFRACYWLVWQVNQCPLDKAGFNCTSERHILQVEFWFFGLLFTDAYNLHYDGDLVNEWYMEKMIFLGFFLEALHRQS